MESDNKEHLDWIAGKYQIMLAAYLNKTSLIEDKIDEIITVCFLGQTKNKWQYLNIILADIPFGSKIVKLKRTLTETKPSIGNLYKDKDLADRLEQIRKRRNLFAHSILNTNPVYLKKGRKDEIALLNPRDKQPHTPIKLKDFDDWNKDAKQVLEILTKFLDTIENNNN